MFKAVGNLQTNNGKRIVKWAQGQMRLGRPEPIWFDTVARLHPPLSFASAPEGHRQQEPMVFVKPERIVFPEDASGAVERMVPLDKEMPVSLGSDFGGTTSPAGIDAPITERLREDAERLSKEYLVEEQVLLEQTARIKKLRDAGGPTRRK